MIQPDTNTDDGPRPAPLDLECLVRRQQRTRVLVVLGTRHRGGPPHGPEDHSVSMRPEAEEGGAP